MFGDIIMLLKCTENDYMNVNLHLTGELERFINELVERGLAANKTEAIRMAIVRYYEELKFERMKSREEAIHQSTIEAHWDNPEDEKSSEFYIKRYLNGKKA
jgi:Arc/MetJ-type ribon-helix-helix transcriptional regulator